MFNAIKYSDEQTVLIRFIRSPHFVVHQYKVRSAKKEMTETYALRSQIYTLSFLGKCKL